MNSQYFKQAVRKNKNRYGEMVCNIENQCVLLSTSGISGSESNKLKYFAKKNQYKFVMMPKRFIYKKYFAERERNTKVPINCQMYCLYRSGKADVSIDNILMRFKSMKICGVVNNKKMILDNYDVYYKFDFNHVKLMMFLLLKMSMIIPMSINNLHSQTNQNSDN